MSKTIWAHVALAYLVVVSMVAMPTPALAQARATVVASARVVDAGAAWAAYAAVEAELGRLAGRGTDGKMPVSPVRVTEHGGRGSSSAAPGSSAVAGRVSVADVAVVRAEGAAAGAAPVSGGAGTAAPVAVIYVAHVAN